MKLLFCKSCNDLFSLNIDYRTCHCGESGGNYKDNKLDIVINGPAVPVGINNGMFLTAVNLQGDFGEGIPFDAFVIPKNCPTVNYKDVDIYKDIENVYEEHEGIIEELEEEKDREVSRKVNKVKNVFKDKDEK